MTEELTINTERIDDIPLLLAQLDRMQVGPMVDEYFPAHGNWQGLSLGTVVTVWLTFILSEANHRLSHVQAWAAQRLTLLAECLGQRVRALDLSDDRLAAVLDYLSEDQAWSDYEQALNRRMLRVYELAPERVRIDSTTAKGYIEVSPEGLFQFGHSKDHRPDLPQIKINLSVLDPLGLPLTTTVVAGQQADDPLYVPEIKRVQQSLGCQGVTYIGDSKMAALQTRAYVVKSQNYYLCPLPAVQVSREELATLLEPVWTGIQPLQTVVREEEEIACGYTYTESLHEYVEGERITWTERRLVVRSLPLAQAQGRALEVRLSKALAAIAHLNERAQGKRRFTEETELQGAVEQLVMQYHVQSLLTYTYHRETCTRHVRAYGSRPASTRVEQGVTVVALRNETAVQKTLRSLGWRVYATNQPAEHLSLEQAVLAYRAEYLVEQTIGRLKGKALSVTPLYLETDTRILGLVRLLMIALRVLTLLEFSARRSLQQAGEKLAGIYPGNPKRATARPTTEMLLQTFKGVTLTLMTDAHGVRAHVTPLSTVQQRILLLLGFASDLYLRLSLHFSKPALNLSEP
jgi:transposase